MLQAKIDLDKMQAEQEVQLSVKMCQMENNFQKARQDAVIVNKVISFLEQKLPSSVVDISESWLEKLEVCSIVAQSEKTSLRLTLKTFESVDDFQSFIGELPLEPLILTEARDPLILPRYENSCLEESVEVMSDTGSKYVLSVRRKHSMTIIDITAFMVIHGHVIEVVGKVDSSDRTLYIQGTEGEPDASKPNTKEYLFNNSSLTSVYTVKRRLGDISKFYVY